MSCKLIKCPNCGSYKVFCLRIDNDWGWGIGDYEAVNPRKYYTDEEFEMDATNRPDIELYACHECGWQWIPDEMQITLAGRSDTKCNAE